MINKADKIDRMTIREDFAKTAMHAFLLLPAYAEATMTTIAGDAVAMADMLIDELNKPINK